MTTRFAVVDYHQAFAEALSVALSGFDGLQSVGTATTLDGFVALARTEMPDVFLVDYQLREGTALDYVATLRAENRKARLILMTAHASVPAWALEGFEQLVSKGEGLDVVANAVRVPGHPTTVVGAHGLDRVQFSRRQQEVLELMGQGHDPAGIATILTISIHTARGHVKAIMRLLDAPTQLAAVVTALREGYLLPPLPRQRSEHPTEDRST